MKDTIRNSLVDYFSRGWVTLPVRVVINPDTGKKEYTEGLLPWRGKKKRFSRDFSLKQLEKLGVRANGVVVFTGHNSNLLVIDVDSDTPEVTLRDLGITVPENTVRASTPRGGRHFYFTHPKKLAGTTLAHIGGKAVDIRGARGFITAPPTEISGKGKYFWIVSPDQGIIQPPPAKLIQLIRRHNRIKRIPPKAAYVSSGIKPIGGKSLSQLSSKQQEIFFKRLENARKAIVGQRSSKDYCVLDWVVRIGMEKEEAWEYVKDIGKFRERGRDYFEQTYNAVARKSIKP
ncbi:MAG: hypothetical protein A2487_13540 [Candidatus Raymondbacteria bacterium RifOxyC12_full_50_8]|uniref:DNA primase/polymerase bifunctional N-terminal domain-containing protein n=1 Tax=Candidatus Raymondbacteria bacterium RIFOXYD12_FULL_49_13 TaxID=1817890 RepID=A0A1F7F822_UNCRA|nr:MAG: hypothetical protein A2248_13650 [Candidatus Raymondbacteria bacterium RIFOXYA2_FULL_49_16]OGJ95170.1 MAG: hypothetical protein A2350_09505 [Candidatus Raymondbacteria bacterium RifOxyB12_full_50_8]OGK00382.1 MAG: hypothetical protein A2487_13540 [Candidatus Raymondbacteria bacterium RifOxyC12_full_50_8]OGK02702.1 MAG: hypothetical protein A2519_09575 [Candidatus Raymondbacteria bacterium RIFOXYD12_FULL_49_13]OGP42348.1 MAG: hypothetical protein A2324_20245 [Candidatus Raymondbacteria b